MQLSRRLSAFAIFVKPGILLGLVLSLAVGVLAYFVTLRTIEHENELRFQSMARTAQFTINARIRSYTYVLRAMASMFNSTPEVTRQQFHRYVTGLDLATHYPAIETLNFMAWVRADERDAFEAKMRREQQEQHLGGPPFRIFPPGRRPNYSALVLAEPAAYLTFLGRDMTADPNYLKKYLESRDTGEIATSGMPVPVMMTQKRLGLAMRLPVYRPGAPLDTVEQRREAFRGSVGVAFNVAIMVHGVLDDVPVKPVRFSLFNVNELNKNKPVRLIYDSATAPDRPPQPQDFHDPTKFHVWLPVDFNGHPWTVHFSVPKKSVNRRSDASIPLLAMVAGFTTTMLLYGLYYTLTSSRSRALELAKEMTMELRDSQAELIRSHHKLRRLAAHAEHIKEAERKRIAREIHDDLGQNLLALRIEAELLFSRTRERHPRLHARAGATLNHIDRTIKSVRQIINDLRPTVLDLGLNAAVDWQVADFRRRTGILCDLVEYHRDIRVNDELATAAFRILQESLSNVRRHAHANWVRVDLLVENGWLRMSIRDNGTGFVRGARKPGSFGLLGIEERVNMLGGTFSIGDAPGGGTVIDIALPTQQENPDGGQRPLSAIAEESLHDELA
ncbi:CHASE domain-containing protein [Massilia agilis]|uniref:CHASE domain-containing protein n=1 Tax=Massilia agilis TaxID=1811226 RepID=A0ABT2DBU6_9BURK|nr:CHASE domain-containing protein [Massilia agilis]MCS0808801.1 CHASE domain-containing protein [Massilia agilis]